MPFRVTKSVAGLSVNKHKQTTRPVLGAQSSTKLSTFRKPKFACRVCRRYERNCKCFSMTLMNSAPPLLLLSESHQKCDEVLSYLTQQRSCTVTNAQKRSLYHPERWCQRGNSALLLFDCIKWSNSTQAE